MKLKSRTIQIFTLTPQMTGVGLLLTYVAYPLALLLEFSSFGAASPGNAGTFNLMTVIFFISVFMTGGFLSFSDERSIPQRMKTLIFLTITLIPTLAFHSAKFVLWFLDIKI